MEALVAKLAAELPDGLRLVSMGDRREGLINISGVRRELERADVDALRAALAGSGYVEVMSWVATEGASWLSPGVQSISMIIAPGAVTAA